MRAPTAALRRQMQEATRAVAAHSGFWPLDQQATDWLFGPGPTSGAGDPEILVGQTATGASLFALRFGNNVEAIAPDSETAAGLLPALLAALPPASLVWTRGLRSPVAAAALALGLSPVRRLMVLVRELDQPLGEPRLPAGFTIRPFRPGTDDTAWLALNRAAFTALPDQGRWTAVDLRARLSAAWFDPASFLLLHSPNGDLAGCVWVKLPVRTGPPELSDDPHVHRGGEIFILAVHPRHHGTGLGRALLGTGLARIRAAGCHHAHLYVDSENDSAGSLYRAAGFTPRERILAFASPPMGGPAGPPVTGAH